MQQITIAALELTSGDWCRDWSGGQRRYTYRATVEPLVSDAGQLRVLTPDERRLLATAGYRGDLSATATHQDTDGGGSPDAATIGQEQLQAVGAAYAALVATWLGRTVTLEIVGCTRSWQRKPSGGSGPVKAGRSSRVGVRPGRVGRWLPFMAASAIPSGEHRRG
jgi:hypothetical protein